MQQHIQFSICYIIFLVTKINYLTKLTNQKLKLLIFKIFDTSTLNNLDVPQLEIHVFLFLTNFIGRFYPQLKNLV